jgi:hypothetical protein
MALLFYDGFDCYADRAECETSGWAATEANTTFSTTLGLNGGGCLTTSGISNNRGWVMGFPRAAQGTTMTVGAWVYFGSLPSGTDNFMKFLTNFDLCAQLNISNTGTLSVTTKTGGTSTPTGTIISIETWYWIEFQVLFSTDDVNGAWEVRVGGSTVTSASGVSTRDGTRGIDHLELSSGDASTDVRFDDVYITDDSGSEFLGFLGVSYIETLTVDADGGTVDWTRNTGSNDWEMVDDADAAADDDTTYVDSSTVAQETRFAIPVPTETADLVKAVQIRARMRKQDAGTRTVRGLMNVNGGGEEILFDEVGLTTEYCWLALGLRTTNDTGGDPWDTTEVGLTEIGVEVVV